MKSKLTQLIFIGCLALSLYACDSDPCRFNIDKHEILTGIDIPKTQGGACIPHEQEGFKISIWQIDTVSLSSNSTYGGLKGYMDYYHFEKLQGKLNEEKLKLIPENYQSSLSGDDLFYKSGERGNKKWIMILSFSQAVLFGEIIELQKPID